MTGYSHDWQDHELRGKRVRLVRCADPFTRLTPGALGTVTLVDGVGTVHVRWDDGHQLGLVADAGDQFEVLDEPPDRARQAPYPYSRDELDALHHGDR